MQQAGARSVGGDGEGGGGGLADRTPTGGLPIVRWRVLSRPLHVRRLVLLPAWPSWSISQMGCTRRLISLCRLRVPTVAGM